MPDAHPLTGTWRVAEEEPGGCVLLTVTTLPGGALAVAAIDTADGEDFRVEVLKQAERSVTFRMTSPSHGGTVLKRLWLNSDHRPVVTLQYDEPWRRVLDG